MAKKIPPEESDTSPAKMLAADLAGLRRIFSATLRSYQARIEGDIALVKQAALDGGAGDKVPSERIRDLRDMLTLVRRLEVKPAKGRRRDLRKIENVIDELRELIEHWNL